MNADLNTRLSRIETTLTSLTEKRKGGRPKGTGEKVNAHLIERMKALRSQGWTLAEIAGVFGVGEGYVGDILRDPSVPVKAEPLSPLDKARAKLNLKPGKGGEGFIHVSQV